MQIIAHRGVWKYGASENTMQAFEKAIEMKCDALEFDVFITKDEVPIVAHGADADYRVRTKAGELKLFPEMLLEEVLEITYDNGDKIPLLKDVLPRLKGKIKLFIDLKGKDILVFEKTMKLVWELDMLDQSTFISFTHDFFYNVDTLYTKIGINPFENSIKFGFLMEGDNDKPDLNRVSKLRNHILDVDMTNLLTQEKTKKFIMEALTLGIGVVVYCYPITVIESKEQIEQLIDMGVSGITTNDPEILINFKGVKSI